MDHAKMRLLHILFKNHKINSGNTIVERKLIVQNNYSGFCQRSTKTHTTHTYTLNVKRLKHLSAFPPSSDIVHVFLTEL
jgi:hypothetical protein